MFKDHSNISRVLEEECPHDIFDKVMGELKGGRIIDRRMKK